MNNVAHQAQSFLKSLKELSVSESVSLADDLLVYFYRLRDHHKIVKSSSPRIVGKSFTALNDLIYNLESRPDETLRNEEWRTFIRLILEDIASGRIGIDKNS